MSLLANIRLVACTITIITLINYATRYNLWRHDTQPNDARHKRFAWNDTQHNNALHCAECRYADCLVLFMLCFSVIKPSVVMLNVIILSALAPNLL